MSCVNVLALALTWTVQAESDAQSSATLAKAWLKVFTRQAAEYRLCPANKPKQLFKLLPHPVFRHSAPSRGNDDIGAMYLWVYRDGRPAVIGTIFGWSVGGGFRDSTHEFHSLAAEAISGVWTARYRWSPKKAGVTWQVLPDAPVPGKSAVQGMRQMRELSRRFKAHSIDHRGGRWELRLIPKPFYRYEIKDDDSTLGGALFAICQDTNTDVILCIEARQIDADYRWHYACATFADWELHVQLDDVEVWSDPSDRQASRGPTDVHWVKTIRRIKLPEDHEAAQDK